MNEVINNNNNPYTLKLSNGSYIVANNNSMIRKFNKKDIVESYATYPIDGSLFNYEVLKITLSKNEKMFAVISKVNNLLNVFDTETMVAHRFNIGITFDLMIKKIYFNDDDKEIVIETYNGGIIRYDSITGEDIKYKYC